MPQLKTQLRYDFNWLTNWRLYKHNRNVMTIVIDASRAMLHIVALIANIMMMIAQSTGVNVVKKYGRN
jgi:hypothetical protein